MEQSSTPSKTTITSSSEPTVDLEGMSVKEMKAYLTERGVDFADCFEKSDLKKIRPGPITGI